MWSMHAPYDPLQERAWFARLPVPQVTYKVLVSLYRPKKCGFAVTGKMHVRYASHGQSLTPLPIYSNNMLYPKEDKAERVLKYACRHCGYEKVIEDSEDWVVYTNELKKELSYVPMRPWFGL